MPKVYVLCSLLTRTQGSLAFPLEVVGNTFVILGYSKARGQKCLLCGAI